jgi:hypothetical protein
MFRDVPPGAAPITCAFRGDPNSPPRSAWRAWPVLPRRANPALAPGADEDNTYLGISSFHRGEDGRYRRRKGAFAAMHALMLDDLGTGAGAMLEMSRLALPATALIETSENNYQAFLALEEPNTDRETAEALISATIYQGLAAAADPGMAGVARVGRLPVGVNGKPKHRRQGRDWRVRLAEWRPDVRYSLEEIVEAYGLDLAAARQRPKCRRIGSPLSDEQIREHAKTDPYLTVLADLRLVLSAPVAHEDTYKVDVLCPWHHQHSDRSETGAAYFGRPGFCCHHGHCAHRRT